MKSHLDLYDFICVVNEIMRHKNHVITRQFTKLQVLQPRIRVETEAGLVTHRLRTKMCTRYITPRVHNTRTKPPPFRVADALERVDRPSKRVNPPARLRRRERVVSYNELCFWASACVVGVQGVRLINAHQSKCLQPPTCADACVLCVRSFYATEAGRQHFSVRIKTLLTPLLHLPCAMVLLSDAHCSMCAVCYRTNSRALGTACRRYATCPITAYHALLHERA